MWDDPIAWENAIKPFACLLGQVTACQPPTAAHLVILTAAVAGLAALCLAFVKKVIEKGFEQRLLAFVVASILIIEFVLSPSSLAAVVAICLFVGTLLIQTSVSQNVLPIPFTARERTGAHGGPTPLTVRLDTALLVAAPIVYLAIPLIAEPIYFYRYPPPPKPAAMFLIPPARAIPGDVKRTVFAQFRAALLDRVGTQRRLTVLPPDEALTNFPDFDKVFGYARGLSDYAKDGARYGVGYPSSIVYEPPDFLNEVPRNVAILRG